MKLTTSLPSGAEVKNGGTTSPPPPHTASRRNGYLMRHRTNSACTLSSIYTIDQYLEISLGPFPFGSFAIHSALHNPCHSAVVLFYR